MARWVIQREEAFTYCDEPHPVRLGRNPERWRDEPFDRRLAIQRGAKGYMCPGNEPHPYPIWVVFDADDDRRPNAGAFDVYREAVVCRDRLRAEAAQ